MQYNYAEALGVMVNNSLTMSSQCDAVIWDVYTCVWGQEGVL